jgi:ABC-type glycerol-3-phosphate transport system substrate-binding protein
MSRFLRAGAPLLALALFVAACGGAAASPSGAPAAGTPASPMTPSPAASAAAVCVDAAAFKASITALTTLKPLDVGLAGVKAALTDVETSTQALIASGKDVLGQPLTDLSTAVAGLKTTLASLGDQGGLGSAISAIRASIADIGTAAAAVQATLTSTCPAQ